MTRPPWIVWAGLAVVLAAAAVLSFDALRALALAVGIHPHLAWLLPIAVDAGAAVSCATWLGGRTDARAARFAGRMTWALLAVTVAGNAGQLGWHAHAITPPWWVAVLVGAIPPAIVGAVVHLVVLLVRRPVVEVVVEQVEVAPVEKVAEEVEEAPATVEAPEVEDPPPPATPVRLQVARPREETREDILANLVAQGAGRKRVARELGIKEWEARTLIERHRQGDLEVAR